MTETLARSRYASRSRSRPAIRITQHLAADRARWSRARLIVDSGASAAPCRSITRDIALRRLFGALFRKGLTTATYWTGQVGAVPVVLQASRAQGVRPEALDGSTPGMELFRSESVPLTSILGTDQPTLNSSNHISLSAGDPTPRR